MIVNPFLRSSKFAGKKIHLGLTGSVACYKACELLRSLLRLDIAVSATLSSGAREFISPLLVRALGAEPVYGEMFDGVFDHLEPGQVADLLVIAPASADFLAKMASGSCADMLSAQYVAFSGPVLCAPAMNPAMWRHAATQANVQALQERNVVFAGPEKGAVACGQEGMGRLADLQEILLNCLKLLAEPDLAGLNVLVSLGPTREYWDGVRFWSNPSSGRMGAALATSAWLRGANVSAVCGPGLDVFLPSGITRIAVTSAREMFAACTGLWQGMDLGLCCAAVSDYAPLRPEGASGMKIPKAGNELSIKFERNPDILASLGRDKNGRKLLGFAAQIAPDLASLEEQARAKLQAKNADLLAANLVNISGGAFGSDNNSVLVIDRNGSQKIWENLPKADIAWDLLTWLLRL